MEDEFKDQLETLLFFLFPNGTAKPKMVAGTRVLANDLTDYVESYVDLLNSEQGLSALSIFEVKVHFKDSKLIIITSFLIHIYRQQ